MEVLNRINLKNQWTHAKFNFFITFFRRLPWEFIYSANLLLYGNYTDDATLNSEVGRNPGKAVHLELQRVESSKQWCGWDTGTHIFFQWLKPARGLLLYLHVGLKYSVILKGRSSLCLLWDIVSKCTNF